MGGLVSDCQHLAVTWDPYPLQLATRLQTVHWFICDACQLRAVVVITDVVLST
jgi:hypothetical protein